MPLAPIQEPTFSISIISTAISWGATGLVGLAIMVVERTSGWASSLSGPVLIGLGAMAAFLIIIRHGGRQPDWRQLARQIEASHPQLEGRLLTAIQQSANSTAELNFLQQRVIEEALAYSQRQDWVEVIPKTRLALAQMAHGLALALCAFVLLNLPQPERHR